MVSTSLEVFDDGNPGRGLSKVVRVGGVRRLSVGDEEEEDCVGVRMPPKTPEPCRVVEPKASTSACCGSSGLENDES